LIVSLATLVPAQLIARSLRKDVGGSTLRRSTIVAAYSGMVMACVWFALSNVVDDPTRFWVAMAAVVFGSVLGMVPNYVLSFVRPVPAWWWRVLASLAVVPVAALLAMTGLGMYQPPVDNDRLMLAVRYPIVISLGKRHYTASVVFSHSGPANFAKTISLTQGLTERLQLELRPLPAHSERPKKGALEEAVYATADATTIGIEAIDIGLRNVAEPHAQWSWRINPDHIGMQYVDVALHARPRDEDKEPPREIRADVFRMVIPVLVRMDVPGVTATLIGLVLSAFTVPQIAGWAFGLWKARRSDGAGTATAPRG
jgi:hypothetical protein